MWNSDEDSALELVYDTHVAVSIEPSTLPGRTELALSAGMLDSSECLLMDDSQALVALSSGILLF